MDKTPDDILKSVLSVNMYNFYDHVYHSGELYKRIIEAMNIAMKQAFKGALQMTGRFDYIEADEWFDEYITKLDEQRNEK
jgi:hypothetical protein